MGKRTLFIGISLSLLLCACTPDNAVVSTSDSTTTTVRKTTIVHVEMITTSTMTAADKTATTSSGTISTSGGTTKTATASTAVKTKITTTVPTKPTSTNIPYVRKEARLFQKKWSSFSSEEQAFLEACGLTEEVLNIDRSTMVHAARETLEYQQSFPQFLIPPQFEFYYKGTDRYMFLHDAKNDFLTGYQTKSNRSFDQESCKTEEELLAIAKRIAGMMVDTEFYEAPKVKRMDYSSYCLYYYEFKRQKVQGYTTLDGVVIALNSNGTVASINISKLGLLDNVIVPPIDKQWILEECTKILKKRYEGLSSCAIETMTLDIHNGEAPGWYLKQPEIEKGSLCLLCECKLNFVDDAAQKHYDELEVAVVVLE